MTQPDDRAPLQPPANAESPGGKAPPAGEPTHVLSPGHLFAERFEVEAFLGSGAAGEVYRSFDRHRGSQVALRTISPALLTDSAAVQVLREQFAAAGRLGHASVCRLYDIVLPPPLEPGPSFLTMELVEGETLSARVRRGRIETEESYAIFVQLACGLAAAHDIGVVHGALKSGNVMLSPSGRDVRAVIMDVGLARRVHPGGRLRTAASGESSAAELAYMAPEQREGKRATSASDIYSLGVIMCEMATGRLPFEGEIPIVAEPARRNRKAPASILPRPDLNWNRAIADCLHRDPAKRPDSARDVFALLRSQPPSHLLRRILGFRAR